ncbi:MAG: hypothetical protein OEQ29_25020 [Alphaproteobacteria bacterium]|nr:hypothetical protein [Alphaproteobacteria bacterium]
MLRFGAFEPTGVIPACLPPFLDMHNRMKEALVILGRIPCAAVGPPLMKLSEAEVDTIRDALGAAGAGPEGALQRAA